MPAWAAPAGVTSYGSGLMEERMRMTCRPMRQSSIQAAMGRG